MASERRRGSRAFAPGLKVMERDYRRKGLIAHDESFLAWCDGVFVVLYENRQVSSDRPRSLPRVKPRVLAAYTDRSMLFTGPGFRRFVRLPYVVRADADQSSVRITFSGSAGSGFSMLEIEVAGATGRPFVDDLIICRDRSVVGTPADLHEHMEVVKKIRSLPDAQLLDWVRGSTET